MEQCNTALDGCEYRIRKSSRHKRHRDEWHEELVMEVRRSRADGDSEKIAVTSLGGKPSHKKSVEKKEIVSVSEEVELAKFCHRCGLQHEENAKFCLRCGSPRQSLPTKNSQMPPSQPLQPPRSPSASAREVINLVSSPVPATKKKDDHAQRYFFAVGGRFFLPENI